VGTVVLDSLAIDVLGSPEWRKALFEAGYEVLVVPTAVLVERHVDPRADHPIHTALRRTTRRPLDEAAARRAGALRAAALAVPRAKKPRGPSAVDAVVVQSAEAAAANDRVLVLTGDKADIDALMTNAEHRERIAVRRP
jgi:hypothetical protein